MRLLIYTAALAASVLAAGCVLGPNYTRPQVPVPGQWDGCASTGNVCEAHGERSVVVFLSRCGVELAH